MKQIAAGRAALLGFGAASVAVLVAAGCGGGGDVRSENSHQVARSAGLGVDRKEAVRVVPRCKSTAFTPSASLAYAAVVRRSAPARTGPSGRSHLVARYAALDQNGFRTVFGVLGARMRGCRPVWFHVLLPTRPNGSSAWVGARDVRVYPVSSRVVVDLSSRRVRLYRFGALALSAHVAIGSPQTPTPVGRFYVNERFRMTSADGPFGVAALGISAHSDVLNNWVQGGPIALHGTDEPSLIGGAVSHGCVRLPNASMIRLFRLVPAGTPVLIRA
jgi:L,D-transpeptidase catalytic domain